MTTNTNCSFPDDDRQWPPKGTLVITVHSSIGTGDRSVAIDYFFDETELRSLERAALRDIVAAETMRMIDHLMVGQWQAPVGASESS